MRTPKGVFVGQFGIDEINHGLDREAVKAKQKETGLLYTNSRIVTSNGLPIGIKIWVCSLEDAS